jgi:hypothetical protein
VAAADRFHLPNLEVIEVDENITSNNGARMPAVATRKPHGLGQPVQDAIWQPTYPDSLS